jgi:hypothetical protein
VCVCSTARVRAKDERTLDRLAGDPRYQSLLDEALSDLTRSDRLPTVTIIAVIPFTTARPPSRHQ